ncbi:hypothetical protein O3M35_005307 [Rhynocoris fuscipes]|uniref:DUF1279 domain-containing protein n=1 Tax=Rhynocoris fuscipes TaxID=488301 RepID=A0AAW1DQD6_9HEMI
MATLTKLTFLLRDVKVILFHRHNVNLINNLCARSLYAVGNSPPYALKCSNNNRNGHLTHTILGHVPRIHTTSTYFAEPKEVGSTGSSEEETKKLTLFQRFKAMYRDYWYVLVPVHIVTSAFWFGGFYYAAKSGIDIVAFMEKLNFSETIIDKVRNSGHSTTGYIAISYALYKIFTPLRYTVTLGGTTISINYLKKWGYIKPIIKKKELQKMISDKRESLRERRIALKNKVMYKFNQKKRLKKNR